jgi:hypothetical protein
MPDEVDVRVDGCGVERGLGRTAPPFSCISENTPTALFTLSNGECGKISTRMINNKQALKGLSFIKVKS